MREPHRQETKKIEKKTWYGLNAVIISGPGVLHTAGFGYFLIPHPPVVNWLLRQGLAQNKRRALIRIHEYQHFQSAPFVIVYALVLFALALTSGRVGGTYGIVLLISCQAFWEICSEAFTLLSDARYYRDAYAGISMLPRIIFWVFTLVLTLTGWGIVGAGTDRLF